MSNTEIKPKPTRPCYNCGSTDYWWREASQWGRGDWLCGCCHPRPKEEESVKEEVELINGKFVVKGKKEEVKEKEVKPSEPKPAPKQYSETVLALIIRVREGNDKLWNAWNQIRKIPDRDKMEEMFRKWDERKQFLNTLCKELVWKGFNDCLYIDKNGKKTKGCLYNPDNLKWFCNTCPAQLGGGPEYWAKELMQEVKDKEARSEKSL